MTGRSTDAETIERVNKIYQLLIQGWHRPEILQFGVKTWGISERSVDEYIRYANTDIKKNAEAKQKRALNYMLNRHSDLISRAYTEGNLRLALDVDREDAKLMGLYAPEKSSNLNINLNELTDEQLERLAKGENVYSVLANKS